MPIAHGGFPVFFSPATVGSKWPPGKSEISSLLKVGSPSPPPWAKLRGEDIHLTGPRTAKTKPLQKEGRKATY